MSQDIHIINVWSESFLLKGAGGVNCYLIQTGKGYVLIDTGIHSKRSGFIQELERAGCRPGEINLVILTHGDGDHAGNCAYLQKKYGVKIALHRGESEAVEKMNMTLNRKNKPGIIAHVILSFISALSLPDRCKPDIFLNDGDNLSMYGFDARILHLPGHSKGHIGILTASGDLFCGDLFLNIDKPTATLNADDSADVTASIEKLKGLSIHTVYPGHGKPFLMEQFMGS